MKLEEHLLRPKEFDEMITKAENYIKLTGGGIFWIISYFLLYAILSEVFISNFDKLNSFAISFEIYFLLGILGIFLFIAIRKHTKEVKGYDDLMQKKYNEQYKNFYIVYDKFYSTRNESSNVNAYQEFARTLSDFAKEYFPRVENDD